MGALGPAATALALVLVALLAGCGGGPSGGRAAAGRDLKVSAAASLRRAFTAYGARFSPARARFSFAGSDELAAQIERGARPDVFAAANTELPDRLAARGLVSKPVVFASNRLVVAVPSRAARVRTLADLARPGVAIAAGSPSVPVGAYTAKVLARLPGPERDRIAANVRTREPDVAGVVAKVTQGAVDAGFVYRTDVDATSGRVRAIELSPRLSPRVDYGAAVVQGTAHRREATAFVAGLVGRRGRRELRRAGFLPPSR